MKIYTLFLILFVQTQCNESRRAMLPQDYVLVDKTFLGDSCSATLLHLNNGWTLTHTFKGDTSVARGNYIIKNDTIMLLKPYYRRSNLLGKVKLIYADRDSISFQANNEYGVPLSNHIFYFKTKNDTFYVQLNDKGIGQIPRLNSNRFVIETLGYSSNECVLGDFVGNKIILLNLDMNSVEFMNLSIYPLYLFRELDLLEIKYMKGTLERNKFVPY